MTDKKYIDEIKLKDYQIEFQKMVLDISFEFMNIDEESLDGNIEKLLKTIGLFFKVDRTYMFTLNHNNKTMTYSHEWCNEGINPELSTIKGVGFDVFPWWINELKENKLVYLEDVSDMPYEAISEQAQLYRQNVKSLMSVPIEVDGKIHAFIGIDSVFKRKKWTDSDIELLHIMSNILAGGITHINYHKKINFMAYHDSLTGLPNRLLLTDRINQEILRANRGKSLFSVMLINLDGFKMINDTLGHDQGDELLKQISKRLLNIVRKSDTVCRLGGDEFILYINGYKDEESINVIASKILNIFQQAFILKGREYFISASLGISQYPNDGQDVKSLIKNADMAMYTAKTYGKNQYQKCTEELKNIAIETISLTNYLYKAINKNEMILYYQPKIDSLSGKILGVEALLRWKHPELGFIPPFKFIHLAEKTGLILPIGNWVLKTACQQFKEWQNKGFKAMKIAVNFSVHQLNHPYIIKQIKEILDETGMEAEYLEIEITESAAIDIKGNIKETLEKIRSMGISLSIDDFGKEYSSLNRLKELPIDKVKIDMSFVQGIGNCHKDEIIVKTVIFLASEFGYQTIAEGVETKEQVEFLKKYKCDQLQGYYYYRPMPANEIEKLLSQNIESMDYSLV